jgi:hypothetical protein
MTRPFSYWASAATGFGLKTLKGRTFTDGGFQDEKFVAAQIVVILCIRRGAL